MSRDKEKILWDQIRIRPFSLAQIDSRIKILKFLGSSTQTTPPIWERAIDFNFFFQSDAGKISDVMDPFGKWIF